MNAFSIALHKSLNINPSDRNFRDIQTIASFLQSIAIFTPLSDEELHNISETATLSIYEANTLIYRKGDENGPWYLILTGTVLINKILYNQFQPFGYEVSPLRPYECFVIDKTEVMVIYSAINWSRYDPISSSHYYSDYAANSDDQFLDQISVGSIPSLSNENASSIVETSSLYSIAGSSSGIPDFVGLQESAVDSDVDESLSFSEEFFEALKKNLDERTDCDIKCISNSLLNFQVFQDMPFQTLAQLSAVMTYAEIFCPEQVLLSDGEKLDSWTILLVGELCLIKNNGMVEELRPGSCFGVEPTEEEFFHKGIIHTLSECRLGVVAQNDYARIIKETEEKTLSVIEKGQIVMVTQLRNINGRGQCNVLLRATSERLFLELLKDPQSDPTYIEDFLLTYRTFYKQPIQLAEQLFLYFDDNREKVIFILFDWIQMHYIDFERYSNMSSFLDQVEQKLKYMEMRNYLRRLHELLDAKSKPRSINLSRATREEPLDFSLVESSRKSFYVSDVVRNSKAQIAGIKKGDEIFEVNGQSFMNISYEKAIDILKSSTHLLITLKSNLIGYNDLATKKSQNLTKKKKVPTATLR